MANFWGNKTKLDFHQAVVDLQDLTRYPVDEEYYRHREGSETDARVLKFKDELQLADDLAFLANSEEGVGTVSAVTIQERSDGITVLLASNYTPTETTINGIRNILNIIQKYALKGIKHAILFNSEFPLYKRALNQHYNNSAKPAKGMPKAHRPGG